MKYTRKDFLKMLGMSGAATFIGGAAHAGVAVQGASAAPQKSGLKLGLASYTLRNFKIEEVIRMCKRVGLGSIALKSMHMPLESSAEDVKKIAESVRAAGLELFGAGVIYMKTKQEVETAFAYAANAGLSMIIGAPNHEFLPLINDLVKKYNIKLAIHNHGPGDEVWRTPDLVYEKVKPLDTRIGLCIDIGHVVRISQDPAPMIEKYKDRLYDMHMKDVDKVAEDGAAIEIGRGVIDIPKVVRALKKINYQGSVSFEYEKDGNDPFPGLAESVGYVRGIVRMT